VALHWLAVLGQGGQLAAYALRVGQLAQGLVGPGARVGDVFDGEDGALARQLVPGADDVQVAGSPAVDVRGGCWSGSSRRLC
jgi:hypothetical protein